ncbi:MAG: hypothetical protein U5L45_13490 [Saprospiraceae bacterium]|nr:hypothetical protein [Saprospiraceae bacterium]
MVHFSAKPKNEPHFLFCASEANAESNQNLMGTSRFLLKIWVLPKFLTKNGSTPKNYAPPKAARFEKLSSYDNI